MRKVWIALIVTLFVTTAARAQQKQVLSAAAATCTATGTACLINSVDPQSGGASFTVSANASGNTLQFEASGDGGTTWVALNATPSSSSTQASSTTSTGTWQVNVAGYTNVRIRMSTLVGGTSTVSIIFSTASARGGSGTGLGIQGAASQTVISASGSMGNNSGNTLLNLAQNTTQLAGFYLPVTISTLSMLQYKNNLADNTANLYDLGVYGPNCTSGATNVPLVFHLGAQPGTTLFPTSSFFNMPLAGAPVTVNMVPGWYCFAFTYNGTTTSARLPGGTGQIFTEQFANGTQPANGTGNTVGGALNPTITAPPLAVTETTGLWFTAF